MQKARDVLTTSEAGSFLGDAVDYADENATELVESFLGTFPGLGSAAADDCASGSPRPATPVHQGSRHPFVTPSTAGTSNCRPSPAGARRSEMRSPTSRRPRISASRATRRTPSGPRRRRMGCCAAADRSHRRLLDRCPRTLRSAAELHAPRRLGAPRCGGVVDRPRYFEWHDDTYAYERGAAVAIHELAPGSFFYAQGSRSPSTPSTSAPAVRPSRTGPSAPSAASPSVSRTARHRVSAVPFQGDRRRRAEDAGRGAEDRVGRRPARRSRDRRPQRRPATDGVHGQGRSRPRPRWHRPALVRPGHGLRCHLRPRSHDPLDQCRQACRQWPQQVRRRQRGHRSPVPRVRHVRPARLTGGRQQSARSPTVVPAP